MLPSITLFTADSLPFGQNQKVELNKYFELSQKQSLSLGETCPNFRNSKNQEFRPRLKFIIVLFIVFDFYCWLHWLWCLLLYLLVKHSKFQSKRSCFSIFSTFSFSSLSQSAKRTVQGEKTLYQHGWRKSELIFTVLQVRQH